MLYIHKVCIWFIILHKVHLLFTLNESSVVQNDSKDKMEKKSIMVSKITWKDDAIKLLQLCYAFRFLFNWQNYPLKKSKFLNKKLNKKTKKKTAKVLVTGNVMSVLVHSAIDINGWMSLPRCDSIVKFDWID